MSSLGACEAPACAHNNNNYCISYDIVLLSLCGNFSINACMIGTDQPIHTESEGTPLVLLTVWSNLWLTDVLSS
jgi:hypothetical protein